MAANGSDEPRTTHETLLTIKRLNVDQLKKDMNDPAIKAELQNNMKLAGSLGIMGTPSFVIDSNTQSKEHLYSIFIPGGVSEAFCKVLL